MSDLDLLLKKIIQHPYFQKTKDIIENNTCHSNESVYEHLLTTEKRAEKAATGDFISDPQSKKLFLSWMDEEKFGLRQKNLSILAALTHDIGKIIIYKENAAVHSINEIQRDGTTFCLGHEYLGSTIVGKIFTDIGMSGEQAEYIAVIIRLHGVLMFPQYDKTKSLSILISEMKALGQGMEKEILFNIYADVFVCPMFQDWLRIIEKMFNEPEFYLKREYFVN